MCSPWSFSCLDCRFLKHPWNNPGMHFFGISTELLKCRQYHPKLNKTASRQEQVQWMIPWNPEARTHCWECPAGWNCWARAAPWSPGTAGKGHWHHLLHFGELSMPWVPKLRRLGSPGQPGFCFLWNSCPSCHFTASLQQDQACPKGELHPSGMKMFGFGNVLCKAEINIQAAGGGRWL